MTVESKEQGQAVAVHEDATIQRATPSALISSINDIVRDPNMDLHKMELMERLLAMQERVMAQQAMIEFNEALAQLQAELPQIDKHGRIVDNKGAVRSKYAKIEDIDKAIKPYLDKFGFSLSYDCKSEDGKLFFVAGKLAHKAGHSDTKYVPMPLDNSQYRSGAQNVGSTISYAKRQLIKNHFNIVEHGEDDDGAGGSAKITQNQADDLRALLDEAKGDAPRFLAWIGAAKFEDILVRDHSKAVQFIEAKRRSVK